MLSETSLWFSHAGLCLSQNAEVKHRWLSVWVLRLRWGCLWPLALACNPPFLPCLSIAPEICLPLVSKASQVLQVSCCAKVGKESVQPVIEMLTSLLLLREHSFTFLHKGREWGELLPSCKASLAFLATTGLTEVLCIKGGETICLDYGTSLRLR